MIRLPDITKTNNKKSTNLNDDRQSIANDAQRRVDRCSRQRNEEANRNSKNKHSIPNFVTFVSFGKTVPTSNCPPAASTNFSSHQSL